MVEQEKKISEETIPGTEETPEKDAEEAAEATKAGAQDADAQEAQDISQEAGEDGGQPEEDPAGEEDAKSWYEKRAEKKQAKLNKKEELFKEQIAQLEDRVKRQMAEFENFRKRTEREKQAMFETGLATVAEEDKEDPFVDGMNRVYKQLLTELDNIGVKPIQAVGQEFDPGKHNAVMQVATEEYPSGVVAQELQKGYTYRDAVVRHSMVAVAE